MVIVDSINKSCDTRMKEGRIANKSHHRLVLSLGKSTGTGDAGSHTEEIVRCRERRQ